MSFIRKFKDVKKPQNKAKQFNSMKDLAEGLRINVSEVARHIRKHAKHVDLRVTVLNNGLVFNAVSKNLIGFYDNGAFYFDPSEMGIDKLVLEKMFGRLADSLFTMGKPLIKIDENHIVLQFYQNELKSPFATIQAKF